MANDNNNINELVADDDPTVELELPILRQSSVADDDDDTLSGRSTKTLTAELLSRQQTIDGLQLKFDQLQAKWQEYQSESKARSSQTEQLDAQLTAAQDRFARKERLIKKRDRKIKMLKSEIRQRDKDQRNLAERYERLQASQSDAGDAASDENQPSMPRNEISARDLRYRLLRADEYADTMRRQLQDIMESNSEAEREIDHLSTALESKTRAFLDLSDRLGQSALQIEELQSQLDTIEAAHEQEIRTLRFELGSAQDTMLEAESLKSQLASDLVDAQEFKLDLERQLGDTEKRSESELKDLQKENNRLASAKQSLEQKLSAKSEAITVLLSELAKKSESVELPSNIEDSGIENDEQTPERSSNAHSADSRAAADHRYSRVLVGAIDDQVLRFPLFKQRITIGRTKENDIQLEAAYVSRRHAVIQSDDETTRIIDWGSKNGIHVNSQRINEHFLQHGDIVIIGKARFRYEEHKKRES